jgi:RND family efflux transporter MFP subunit
MNGQFFVRVLPSALALLFVALIGVACAPESSEPIQVGKPGADASSGNQIAVVPSATSLLTPPVAPAFSGARYALEGICEVKPRTLVPIKSQANGEVTAVRVEVGDAVRKGQILIEISPRALDEQMQRHQLSRERVQKRIELLRLQLATQKREAQILEQLYSEAGNIKNVVAIRERENELESAKIEQRELELRQKELERELRYTQIQSPGDGIIIKRTVEPGQIVNAAGGGVSGGDGLLEIADKSELQLDCAVHADDADLIRARVPLVLLLSRSANLTVPIKIQRIAPMIDSRSQVQQLRFTALFDSAVPPEVLLGARYTLNQAKGAR